MPSQIEKNIEKGNAFRFELVHIKSNSNKTGEAEHATINAGVIVSMCGKKIEKATDISATLCARDGKGFGNQPMTGVAEWQE